jgi:broad specificity phosphatase PhoE
MQIHLIRHGEVANPEHLVYADLPGFALSSLGREQARTTGQRLAASGITRIISSPLERAIETSELIAAAIDAPVSTDHRLSEWRLASRWAGVGWELLPEAFPGELEAYLHDPADLPFSPESLDQLAERVAAAVGDWADNSAGDLAFVSHQDPLHSARLMLTGRSPAAFHEDKPAHASVTTLLRVSTTWELGGYWAPDQ